MDRDRLTDLIAVVLVALAGLLIAYVTFGILQSQASGTLQKYSVSGAVAGALVSISLLGSLYLQFRKSGQPLRDLAARYDELARRNHELENKVIRGAPRPPGFEAEIDDRHRIVLARPRDWEPSGGVIFSFEGPEHSGEDAFPPYVEVRTSPIDEEWPPPDKWYEDYRDSVQYAPFVEDYTAEYIYLGGDPNPLKALKVIAREYMRLTVVKDSLTGVVRREWQNLSREEFETLSRPGVSQDEDLQDRANGSTQSAVPASKAGFHPPPQEGSEHPPSNQRVVGSENPSQEVLTDTATELRGPVIATNSPPGEIGGDGAAQSSPAPAKEGSARQTDAVSAAVSATDKYLRVYRMRVVCYQSELSTLFVFDFLDDATYFPQLSSAFNQVLDSVRFLV